MEYSSIKYRTLCQSEIDQLTKMMKGDEPRHICNRAHAILLLFEDRRRFDEVAEILRVHVNTVRNWADRWITKGIEGLHDLKGRGAKPLDDPLRGVGHTVVDLGADAFTVGRPHPMIDYSLRLRRLAEESRDEQTAVVLLDVVLGYGANPDPASELEDAVRVVLGSCKGYRLPEPTRVAHQQVSERRSGLGVDKAAGGL